MEYRDFGKTGLKVSAIGLGAGHIGDPAIEEVSVERLLNGALDLGINLIDTARSYGLSEERIGRYLSGRRNQFILSTKGGYTFQDYPDWSFEATMGTVDESLKRLMTDYIDIFHLHSCDVWVLEKGEAIPALEKAKEQGKIRIIAYSGENDALTCAIKSDRFGSIQCSVNIFDQLGIDDQLPEARLRGMGVIAKRPLGNAVWRYNSRPDGHSHAVYYDRLKKMNIDPGEHTWEELALRFAAFCPDVDCVIAGTSDINHLLSNLKIIEKGPLENELYNMIRLEFSFYDKNWSGLI